MKNINHHIKGEVKKKREKKIQVLLYDSGKKGFFVLQNLKERILKVFFALKLSRE